MTDDSLSDAQGHTRAAPTLTVDALLSAIVAYGVARLSEDRQAMLDTKHKLDAALDAAVREAMGSH